MAASRSTRKANARTTVRSTTRASGRRTARKLAPIHPGAILAEEFLDPRKLTQYRLAKDISVPPRRINEIVLGKRSISADTALRLARYFNTTPEFWMNLQSRYDLELASDELGPRLSREVRPAAA